MGTVETWNPWRELRDRQHLELRWGYFFGGTRGRIEDAHPSPRRIVTIDARLGRTERRATLAHELVHDERGLLPADCPEWLRAKEERAVRQETARRLVPLEDLQAYVRQRSTMDEPVTALDVAEVFDVPLSVARLACEMAS